MSIFSRSEFHNWLNKTFVHSPFYYQCLAERRKTKFWRVVIRTTTSVYDSFLDFRPWILLKNIQVYQSFIEALWKCHLILLLVPVIALSNRILSSLISRCDLILQNSFQEYQNLNGIIDSGPVENILCE